MESIERIGNADLNQVVKNPLSPVEHPGGVGVNCELFELGVEQFVVSHVRSAEDSLHMLIKTSSDRIASELIVLSNSQRYGPGTIPPRTC